MDELLDGIGAILDAEGARAVLVLGQSYGGQVAQALVQRCPSCVTKLVLSSTGPLAASALQRAILRILLALLPLLPEKTVLALYKKSLLGILSMPDERRAFWQAYLDHIFETRLAKGDVLSHFRTGADALAKYAYGKRDPWPGEVLVLGGEKDAVSSERDRAQVLDYYPNARLAVLPGAGHTPAMEKPGEFAAAVREFFDGQ
jgi:pimeloyl-ACP methyl ester carboxylesterase